MCIRDRAQSAAVRQRAQHAVEAVEHALALFRRDAGAGILDLQHALVAVSYTHLDVYKRQG